MNRATEKTEIARLQRHVDQLVKAAEFSLAGLENLTTEEFSRGGDRPVRVKLAEALADVVGLDDERAREYHEIPA